MSTESCLIAEVVYVEVCTRKVNGKRERVVGNENSSARTMESLSWSSSSFLLAVVFSFLASSARLTESVSLRSLVCNLCSISCRFFA